MNKFFNFSRIYDVKFIVFLMLNDRVVTTVIFLIFFVLDTFSIIIAHLKKLNFIIFESLKFMILKWESNFIFNFRIIYA